MGVLETILIAGAVSVAPKFFGWLWKKKVMRKVPKEMRGPLEAAALAGAKMGANAAVKQFANEQKK